MRRKHGVGTVAALAVAMVCAGCGGSSSDAATDTDVPAAPRISAQTETAEPTSSESSETSETSAPLPPGAQPGLDDYNDDGELDPTCSTQDFGGGLLLRIPCGFGDLAHTPEDGTRLTAGSLYRLPGIDVDLTGISGEMVQARDAAGGKVHILVFNSDNLFETGSAVIGSTDTTDATIRLINSQYSGSAIQVRGHTDATGTASGNQALSESRAAAIASYLVDHRVNASGVTSVGLGSSQPLAEETEPDGSPDVEGQRFNRSVEVVIHLPA